MVWRGFFGTRCNYVEFHHTLNPKAMLRWTVIFLVVAIIAGILGFGGIAGSAMGIAKILFFVFLVLFVISLISGGFSRGRSGL